MRNQNLPSSIKYIVGIDEVGRGPLAGPVAVCACKMPARFDAKMFGKIRDSKKLTPQKREIIFAQLKKLKQAKKIGYSVCFQSTKVIDTIGISQAIRNCLKTALKNIKAKPSECIVLLDGGLYAPKEYKNQKTIIKGDEKERAIAFASIAAKVTRDALMRRLAKRYPRYGFEIHKGYGTKLHRSLVRKHGLSLEHRKTFCRNISI